MRYQYSASVLEQLARHGIIPRDDTPPEFVHDFINDLYVYEIRALKKKMLAGLIPRSDYALAVEGLRKRYPILSLPTRYWVGSDDRLTS